MRRASNKFLLSVVGLMFCLLLSSAQASDINSEERNLLGFTSNSKSFSLLDPQRLKMNHSYSFSYFSGGQTSGSFGVYTTTLKYQLSDPLSLTLSLSYLHQPLSVFRRDALTVRNRILPNFQLHYRPNSSFSLWINVLTLPAAYGPGNESFWRERER
ncbi:MAG: hypothetical protein JSV10_05205 [Candidatus Zixiibacteriota bacterium]|nr:MAG: hypothetical protein JSV10_05205 [candidate division Zixibacteria bacterium]